MSWKRGLLRVLKEPYIAYLRIWEWAPLPGQTEPISYFHFETCSAGTIKLKSHVMLILTSTWWGTECYFVDWVSFGKTLFNCKNSWISMEIHWLEGKIETLIWIRVTNLVHLWFGYQVVHVVKIFSRTSPPNKNLSPLHYGGHGLTQDRNSTLSQSYLVMTTFWQNFFDKIFTSQLVIGFVQSCSSEYKRAANK